MQHSGHIEQFLRAFCHSPWCDTLIEHQMAWLTEVLSKQFGYFAIQIGAPYSLLPAWEGNTIRCKIGVGAVSDHSGRVVCDWEALPFKSDAVDLVVLAHALEQVPDPFALLREVERMLIADGRVIITGFEPMNAWRARWFGRHKVGIQRLSFYAPWRVVDWLQALGFEIEQVQFFPERGWRRWLPWFATPCSQGYALVAKKTTSRVRLLGLTDGWHWRLMLPQLAKRNMPTHAQHCDHDCPNNANIS